jgi:hypothetical protein
VRPRASLVHWLTAPWGHSARLRRRRASRLRSNIVGSHQRDPCTQATMRPPHLPRHLEVGCESHEWRATQTQSGQGSRGRKPWSLPPRRPRRVEAPFAEASHGAPTASRSSRKPLTLQDGRLSNRLRRVWRPSLRPPPLLVRSCPQSRSSQRAAPSDRHTSNDMEVLQDRPGPKPRRGILGVGRWHDSGYRVWRPEDSDRRPPDP